MIKRYAECYKCETRIEATCPDTHAGALQADALIVQEGWEYIGSSDGVWICPKCYEDEYKPKGMEVWAEYVGGGGMGLF